MEKEARLTPLMIARLLGVPVGDGSEDSGDETRGDGDPLDEVGERTSAKGQTMTPSVTIGLVVIGMMMVAVGALLIFPISLSIEHARIIGGLGFFVVGVPVIFSAATRASSSNEGTQ